eukprot:4291893-Prymnesium_polylepis.1
MTTSGYQKYTGWSFGRSSTHSMPLQHEPWLKAPYRSSFEGVQGAVGGGGEYPPVRAGGSGAGGRGGGGDGGGEGGSGGGGGDGVGSAGGGGGSIGATRWAGEGGPAGGKSGEG